MEMHTAGEEYVQHGSLDVIEIGLGKNVVIDARQRIYVATGTMRTSLLPPMMPRYDAHTVQYSVNFVSCPRLLLI